MRYVPFKAARLQVRTRRAARRVTSDASRYVLESLAMTPDVALPWHRGFVSMGNIVVAIGLAWAMKEPSAAYISVGFALLFTLADGEGTLEMRLQGIGWAAAFMAIGSFAGLLLEGQPGLVAGAFTVLTFLAGILSWAGQPFLKAPRFGAVMFCLVLASDLESVPLLAALLAGTAITAVVLVAAEHRLAPDAGRSPYSTFAIARGLINADRYTALRFALCYVAASALGWAAGRVIDEAHPTWVAISVMVVMWPDWQKSYQRVLQRVFGTLVGAAVAMVVAPAVADPRLLTAILVGLCFFLPYGIRRNYWLHCALMALVVFLGMKLATEAGFTRSAVEERVGDIVLGCSIAVLGTLFAFRRRDRPEPA